MILYSGVRAHTQGCFVERILSLVILAKLEISPAQRVEISPVGGIETHCQLDLVERFLQIDAAIRVHVTEIVQSDGALGIGGNYFLEFRFGLIILLFALVSGTAQEAHVLFIFRLGGKLTGLVESLFGIVPSLEPRIHNGQAQVNVAVVRSALQQRADIGQRFLRIAGIGDLGIEYHAKLTIVRHLLRSLFCDGSSLRPLFGFAISIDDVLISGLGVVIAQRDHLAESFHGGRIIFLIAIDHSKALNEDSAIVAIGLRVTAVRFFRFLQKVLQNLDGVVVAALGFIDYCDVVRNFQRIRHHSLGFFQAIECLIVFTLAAVDFRDAQIGLSVFRIRVGDYFVLIESGINLAIIQQVFGQAADGVEIVAIEFYGVLVGVDGVLVIFALLISSSESGVEFGGASGIGDRAQHLQGVRSITFVGVEQSKSGNGLF